jgi:hypothetical protein
VYVHLITFVQLVKLLCKYGSMEVNRVLVLRHRHKLSVSVSIVKLVDVVLVEVRVTATIVASSLHFVMFFICLLLHLFLGLLF